MKYIKVLLLSIIIFCFYGLPSQHIINADNKIEEIIDSIDNQDAEQLSNEKSTTKNDNETTNFQDAQSQYVQLLEKINNQLSLSWTAYDVILAIITSCIAIMAILFSFFVWSQNKDYKEKLKKERVSFEEKTKEIFKKIQDHQKEKIESLDSQFKEAIEKHEKELSELLTETKVPEEKIDLIEEMISKIQKDKELLEAKAAFIAQPKNISGVGSSTCVAGYIDTYHKCSHCGFGYYVSGSTAASQGVFSAGIIGRDGVGRGGYETVTCPKCGNVDSLY